MGVVYQATDTRLGRTVALKLLLTDEASEGQRMRFMREARAASALNHPNIAIVYEFDGRDGIDVLAMEFVDGVTLQQLLSERRTPQTQLLEYARQVALAVSAAHGAGVVHRDLKPGNIMIARNGIVKVLDFGLAKIASQSAEPDATRTQALTRTGAVMGTPAYMSPEQVAGHEVDFRADIFAFGVILYEIVCGERPFRAPNPHSILHLVATAEPRSVREVKPSAPPRLVALIESCLKKKKEERLGSMEMAAAELEVILKPVGEAPRAIVRRRAFVGAAIAGAAVIGGVYWFSRPAPVHTVTFRIETRGQDGQPQRASFGDVFDSGTRFRLGAKGQQAGEVFVLNGSDGRESVLFRAKVAAEERVQTEWLVLEGPAGSDRVWLAWSGLKNSSHTSAARDILSKLSSTATPSIGDSGEIELRSPAEVVGTQVAIRHR